jgi:hypothetical protein
MIDQKDLGKVSLDIDVDGQGLIKSIWTLRWMVK